MIYPMESLEGLPKETSLWVEISIISLALLILCLILWRAFRYLASKFPVAKIFSFPLIVGIIGFGGLYLAERIAENYKWKSLIDLALPIKKVLVVIVLTLLALGYLEILLKRFQKKAREVGVSKGKFSAIRKICHFVIYLIALLVLFQMSGLSIGPILTFGGIGVAALALASQDILSNFFGGLMIFFKRPFYEGDEVLIPSVSNFRGTVSEVGLYVTLFEDKNKQYSYFPNSLFCKSLIVNHSRTKRSLISGTVKIGIESRKNLSQLIQDFREMTSEFKEVTVDGSEFSNVDLTFNFTLVLVKLEPELLFKKKVTLFNQLYELVSPYQGSVKLTS